MKLCPLAYLNIAKKNTKIKRVVQIQEGRRGLSEEFISSDPNILEYSKVQFPEEKKTQVK